MNLTTMYPPNTESVSELRRWCIGLINDLQHVLCNLDSGNVQKAAAVAAENIQPGIARDVGLELNHLSIDADGFLTAEGASLSDVKIWSPNKSSYLRFSNSSGVFGDCYGALTVHDSEGLEKFGIVYRNQSGYEYYDLTCMGVSRSLLKILNNTPI